MVSHRFSQPAHISLVKQDGLRDPSAVKHTNISVDKSLFSAVSPWITDLQPVVKGGQLSRTAQNRPIFSTTWLSQQPRKHPGLRGLCTFSPSIFRPKTGRQRLCKRAQNSVLTALFGAPMVADMSQFTPDEIPGNLPERLLCVADVQAVLNVSRSTVLRLMRAGELEHISIGRACRILPHSVTAFIERLRTTAPNTPVVSMHAREAQPVSFRYGLPVVPVPRRDPVDPQVSFRGGELA
jgi:excisionase family DNA binding protein